MQNLQITDEVASQLYELAEHEHISATELMGQLVKTHKAELMKRNKLKWGIHLTKPTTIYSALDYDKVSQES